MKEKVTELKEGFHYCGRWYIYEQTAGIYKVHIAGLIEEITENEALDFIWLCSDEYLYFSDNFAFLSLWSIKLADWLAKP